MAKNGFYSKYKKKIKFKWVLYFKAKTHCMEIFILKYSKNGNLMKLLFIVEELVMKYVSIQLKRKYALFRIFSISMDFLKWKLSGVERQLIT